ncbi:MAG: hypothetical protein J5823_02935 [Paludibacteraceae bacterium]|nr:hypothetical protein [Paludibacteraceae bacterium]
MKKTFVTVMLILAANVAINATSFQHDTNVNNVRTELDGKQLASADDRDIYREYALNSEENDKHIVRFYDIDHIVIRNDQHALIRIYDAKWQLIEQTTDDVDKDVRAGNYYVTCSSRIKSSYAFGK